MVSKVLDAAREAARTSEGLRIAIAVSKTGGDGFSQHERRGKPVEKIEEATRARTSV